MTIEDCDAFRTNAIEQGQIALAFEARQRKVQIKAENYGSLSEVESECIEALYAYEEVLSEKRGRRQPASRTWPMIKRLGIISTVEKVVNRKADAIGYTALVDLGLKEYAFEAVILRHPEMFSVEAVERSKQRMADQVNVSADDVHQDWSDEELLASVHAYVEMQQKVRAGEFFTKKSYYNALNKRFGRTAKSFEYRMQNISYVLALMGRNWLSGLKPAKNVGVNVAVKIEAMLNEVDGKEAPPVVAFEFSVLEELEKPNVNPPLGNSSPSFSSRNTIQFDRDPKVKAWVLKRAKGRCECCNNVAPFTNSLGQPYLEVHHVHHMADNGPDTITNAVALCPNCHRELHFGINSEDLINKLYSSLVMLNRTQ